MKGKRYVYVWADGLHFDIRTTYEATYPKTTERLSKDRNVLLTFCELPAGRRLHVRTMNPIESTFSTLRPRRRKSKGSGGRTACLTMVYKRMRSASKSGRSLSGSSLLREVIAGGAFEDGVRRTNAA